MYRAYRKKFTVLLSAGVLFSTCAFPACANSAPGEPSTLTSVFTVAESTPVSVQSENLTFKIDAKAEKSAHVTAEYKMHNPSGKDVTVNMLFPTQGNMLRKQPSHT